MAEKEAPVTVVRIDYECDKCKKGLMLPSGSFEYASMPPRIPHKCNVCGESTDFTTRYPTIAYRRG